MGCRDMGFNRGGFGETLVRREEPRLNEALEGGVKERKK